MEVCLFIDATTCLRENTVLKQLKLFSKPESPFLPEPLHNNSHKRSLKAFAGNRFVVASLILIAVLAANRFDRPIVSDSRWSVHTAVSIIKEGNTDLNEYSQLLVRNNYYETNSIDGKIYTRFPLGASLVEIPFVMVADPILHTSELAKNDIPYKFEQIVASFIISLTAAIIYLIGDLYFDKKRYSIFLAFIFAFCTSAWSTASLALFQHGPSMLMLTLALYLILLAKNRPWLIQFASLPLAFSYVTRPTNSIAIIFLSVFVIICYRKYFLLYVMWALPVVIPFLWFSLSVYGSWLSPYYSAGRLGAGSLGEALAGNLISPARGLLIFSPIFILSYFGIVIKIRNKTFEKLDFVLAAIIVAHWLAISMIDTSKDTWWGGHSFGPRLFSDMIPFQVYFLIPALMALSKIRGLQKAGLGFCVAILVSISFFAHFKGATSAEAQEWNMHPDIMLHQERIWDWGDVPYLRWEN